MPKRLSARERTPSAATHWIVPLNVLAVVSAIFGFVCLAVLVIVTAVTDQNALATVALALAILAFSVQLIIFVAEESAGREQGRRNEELHGLMRALLGEIKEKAAGTQADVKTINERLLASVLTKSVVDAQGGGDGIDYTRLTADVAALVRSGSITQDGGEGVETDDTPPFWPPRVASPRDSEIIEEMNTFPSADEVGNSLEILRSLSEDSQERLEMFGDDERTCRSPGSSFDPALSNIRSAELLARELIEPVEGFKNPIDQSPLMHLTDRGREVARLLTASEKVPDYLEGLREIRENTRDQSAEGMDSASDESAH